jgi:hypothetical protein
MKHDNGTTIALGLGAGLAALAALSQRGSASQALVKNVTHPWKDVVPPVADAEVRAHMTPAKGAEILEAIYEERGHYGRGRGRRGGVVDAWTFNIKVYPTIPQWVLNHLGEQAASERLYEIMGDERDWAMELFSAEDSYLYQPWLCGVPSTAGSQGGYLVLPYGGLYDDLEERLDEYDDEARVVLGGRKMLPAGDYRDELFEATKDAMNALRRREWLEKEIKTMTDPFEKYWSSDEAWYELLDVTKQEIAKQQAAQQAQRSRRGW